MQLTVQSAFKVSIKQTASESQCLIRLLPLFIGHKIPSDDKVWELYTQFLNILDYILAPTLQIGEIFFMETLISEFLQSFYNTNESLNVKPKAHFLIHYGSQFRVFGPLIHHSTLRFEGKHAYMKSIMSRSKNYRNTCKTMARRHQYMQCLHHLSDSYLVEGEVTFTKSSVATSVSVPGTRDPGI